MSRDSIKPDVTMFTAAGIEEMEGKPIVALRVQKDTSAPLLHRRQGYSAGGCLREAGGFIRPGDRKRHPAHD